ncbi:MAG: hypothetical protein WD448_08470, partial [Woeseia sp.]
PRYRGGPMHYADSVGLGEVLRTVQAFEKRFGSQYWTPPELMQQLAASGDRFASMAVSRTAS